MRNWFEKRGVLRGQGQRVSRHYYDVHRIFQSELGARAVADRELGADCVAHARMFFNSPDIGLDRAAPGTFSLSVTCHGPDVSHRQAGLRLDLDGSARTLQNELIRRTSATDPSERMPPPNSGKTPLTPAQIELLKTWLKQGAPWQPFWSFIPPKRPELPKIDGSDIGFPLNPIDTFIVSRLEREGLHPTHEAEKRLLIRRVSLDLTGLPPTPAEVADFAGDPEPNAYERVVDRLLASPSDGEKMAYRWMENGPLR